VPEKYLSIIVPVFNAEATLGKCLQAISKIKGFNECELIIADDGSTDSSLEIAKKYTGKIVSSPKNKGAAFVRNLGAKSASGEFLLFVDSDVVFSPVDILSYLKEDFARNDICGIYGVYEEKVPFNNFSSVYKHLYTCFGLGLGQRMSPRFFSTASSATLAVSRKTFLESGGFNESFPGVMAEDIEFSLRLVIKTNKLWYLDDRIKGQHIKKYTPLSLLKSDYSRVKGIAKATQKKDFKLAYLKSCSSSSLYPFIAAFLTAVLFFSSIFYFNFLWFALATFLLFFLVELHFFRYLRKKKGILFALLAISFSFCEMVLAGASALYWQLIYKLKK